MKETTQITTPDRVTLELELAGPGSRFVAYLVDLIFIYLICMLLMSVLIGIGLFAFTSWSELMEEPQLASSAVAILVLMFFATFWGYAVFWETVMRGQTPGKRFMGLRVIRDDGLPVGARESVLRNLVRAADMMPPPFHLVGGVVMNLDSQGRRLGDMVAGTLVIREAFDRKRGTRAGAAWAARAEQGQARQGLLLPGGALSARQLAIIEQYLERRHTLPLERREALAWKLVEPIRPLLGEELDAALTKGFGTGAEATLERIAELAKKSADVSRAAPKRADAGGLF